MAAKPLIYTACYYSTQRSALLKNDTAGNLIGLQTQTETLTVQESYLVVCGDITGNVYTGGATSDDGYTTRKFHHDGQLLWDANHLAVVQDIAVDASGNVYTIGEAVTNGGQVFSGVNTGSRTGYYTTRKYNSDGVLQWSIDHGWSAGNKYRLALDSSGNIYTAAQADYTNFGYYGVKKYNSSGVLQWEKDPASVFGGFTTITIDASNNIYLADNQGSAIYIIDTDGNLVDTLSGSFPTVQDIAVDPSGNIVFVTSRSNDISPYTLFKYTSGLSLDWALLDGSLWPSRVAVDADDNVYISMEASGSELGGLGFVAYAFDSSGSQTLSIDANDFLSYPDGQLRGFDIFVIEPEIPSLKIPLSLGLPTLIGDRYDSIPALPLVIALAIPDGILEYVGRDLPPIVYRLYLTGGTGIIELPVSSINCRRGNGATSLSVVCPAPTDEQINAINDRLDGQLFIKRGVRLNDGQELLSEMVRADLQFIRYDAGAGSVSLSMDGKTTGQIDIVGIRSLSGITYRNTTQGVRRVRCSIDTFLQPGYTADLGNGEEMIVGEIVYTISSVGAVMEVVEVPA